MLQECWTEHNHFEPFPGARKDSIVYNNSAKESISHYRSVHNYSVLF